MQDQKFKMQNEKLKITIENSKLEYKKQSRDKDYPIFLALAF